MEVVLVMFKADGEKRNFPLVRNVTVIGRREDCDLRIPLTEISRKHCRIVKDGENVRVEDLGSSNGTYHNGIRVQESIVKGGDSLQIGPVLFTMQIDGFPLEDDITAPQAHDADGPPMGAKIESPPANESQRTSTGAPHRPATPEGDDFMIAADENDNSNDEDPLNLQPPEDLK